MSDIPSTFQLVHRLKRRVRIQIPGLRRDPERMALLEVLLRKHPQLKRVRGVADLGSVAIHFDPKTLPLPRLLAMLDKVVGNLLQRPSAKPLRQPVLTGTEQQCSLAVEGMTCASCAALIELRLQRDPRVAKAQVNFASGTAQVTGRLGRDEVFHIVDSLGYAARPMDTLAQRRLLVEKERARLEEARQRVITAGLLSLPVMVIGMAMPQGMVMKTLEWLLTTPVVFWAGRPFFSKAWKLAKQRQANMDSLIALGAGSAYLYSVPAWLLGRHHLYFEAASGIISFVLLGRYLEERAKGKASEAIRKLIDLQPQQATILRDGQERLISAEELQLGDLMLVRPGERIPSDGIVEQGESLLDESMVSGESLPVAKGVGAKVVGGCINSTGTLRVRVSAVGNETVLAGIIRLVDQAQSGKLPVQQQADRISAVFVPVVMGLSALTGAVWLLSGRGLATAMSNAISVLLIACPCALGLATPTAIMVGSGRAAQRGIFIRGGESLELAAGLSTMVIDKTGTLTEGRPEVTDWINLSPRPDNELMAMAGGAELDSQHFLARAVVNYVRGHGITPSVADHFQAEPGRGIAASVKSQQLLIGNAQWLQQRGVSSAGLTQQAERLAAEGKTPVFFAIDGEVVVLLAIADRPRPEARYCVQALQALGIEVVMVSGDNWLTARHVAQQLGIQQILAEATPAEKLDYIQQRRAAGERVGMVGDGVNDAPALAAADVGFAVGNGTDIAIEAADITLVGGDLTKVAEAVALSRATMRVIKQNLFWALGYNSVAIPGAAAGGLTPMIASLAMAMSSVSVVSNSLRLQRVKIVP